MALKFHVTHYLMYFGGLFKINIFVAVKANVRRVQIALALAVIRSKPEGITAVQHAANIQASCRIKYSNCVRKLNMQYRT
jgi:hypothetical protein